VAEKLGLLLGVGSAICGASAVVAADSVVQGEKQDAPVALGVITLLGTIGIVVYPLLAHALGMRDFVYGVWDGASLHEMAQVVAAARAQGRRVATVVKLVRICLLAPVVLARVARGHTPTPTRRSRSCRFLVAFVAFAALSSLGAPASRARTGRRATCAVRGMAGGAATRRPRRGGRARSGRRAQWLFQRRRLPARARARS
jgi:uncharacterized integral membrane protein (TIGR00698 family)